MKKVFLGGTCNDSVWRSVLIPKLKIDYFNPVVEDWDEEAYKEELRQREICDYCLYVITPCMIGAYSVAEAVDDSNKRPSKTIYCLLKHDCQVEEDSIFATVIPHSFDKSQLKSLDRVGKMVEMNGGKYFKSLEEVADYLNKEEI